MKYWRNRRKSRAKDRLRYRARFAACWVYAPEIGCHLKAMKVECEWRPVRTKSPFVKFKGIGNPGIGLGREEIIRWVRELRGR